MPAFGHEMLPSLLSTQHFHSQQHRASNGPVPPERHWCQKQTFKGGPSKGRNPSKKGSHRHSSILCHECVRDPSLRVSPSWSLMRFQIRLADHKPAVKRAVDTDMTAPRAARSQSDRNNMAPRLCQEPPAGNSSVHRERPGVVLSAPVTRAYLHSGKGKQEPWRDPHHVSKGEAV